MYQAANQNELLDEAKRIMRAALEHSALYIRDEAKRVKRHKGEINKTTQPYLAARHRFKIAWFYEMVRDAKMALKNYEQALCSSPPRVCSLTTGGPGAWLGP